MPTTIGQLAPQVCSRLEELDPNSPTFWQLNTEIYSALVEACSDLLLLVGRPTNFVNVPYTLQPNSIWQQLPPDLLCITNIYGASGALYKLTLWDMDFTQASWQSTWQNDLGDAVERWWPLGLTAFGVHPAVSVPEPVTVTGLQLVTTETWPYDSSVVIPFQNEIESALEMYAAHWCRIKEGGADFEQSLALYGEYLDQAKRLTELSDRRDPYIFSRNLGIQVGVPQSTAR